MINTIENHKPLIISTGISLVAILTMAFYLGAKTETLQTVRDNQISVMAKLDELVQIQNKRDIELTSLSVRMDALKDDVADLKYQIRGRK